MEQSDSGDSYWTFGEQNNNLGSGLFDFSINQLSDEALIGSNSLNPKNGVYWIKSICLAFEILNLKSFF